MLSIRSTHQHNHLPLTSPFIPALSLLLSSNISKKSFKSFLTDKQNACVEFTKIDTLYIFSS